MAAGLGFKTFTTGEVLTAADTNGYLMQGVLVFASAAARDAAITSPQEGQCCYLKDTDAVLTYSGAAWVGFDDSNAIQNSIVDAKGDLISATADNTPARLAVGATNGMTLQVDSTTATGLKWATPSGGFGTWASWTPTWTGLTVGNATQTGSYVVNGKICNFWLKFVLGSTSAIISAPKHSWPVAPASAAAAAGAIMIVQYLDASTAGIGGWSDPRGRDATNSLINYAQVSGGVWYTDGNVAPTTPFTWTSTDVIYVEGSYEVA